MARVKEVKPVSSLSLYFFTFPLTTGVDLLHPSPLLESDLPLPPLPRTLVRWSMMKCLVDGKQVVYERDQKC